MFHSALGETKQLYVTCGIQRPYMNWMGSSFQNDTMWLFIYSVTTAVAFFVVYSHYNYKWMYTSIARRVEKAKVESVIDLSKIENSRISP